MAAARTAQAAAAQQCRLSVRALLAKHARPLRSTGGTLLARRSSDAASVGSATTTSPTVAAPASAASSLGARPTAPWLEPARELEPPPYRQRRFGGAAPGEEAYAELWAGAESLGADLGGVRCATPKSKKKLFPQHVVVGCWDGDLL
jgi:hypothetical protein